MDISNEAQRVINTLSTLEITSTYENMDKLLGCLQVMARIRDAAQALVRQGAAMEAEDGNIDAE